MKPVALFLTFAWLAIIGLGLSILSAYLWPLVIAAVAFTALVLVLAPRKL